MRDRWGRRSGPSGPAVRRCGAVTGRTCQGRASPPADDGGQAAEDATEQVRQAAEEAVQQVGQAAAKATEQVGQAAVEASGKASFTPKNSDEAAWSGGQQRRSASRRSGEGKTTRGSKRGTRSRSSKDAGK